MRILLLSGLIGSIALSPFIIVAVGLEDILQKLNAHNVEDALAKINGLPELLELTKQPSCIQAVEALEEQTEQKVTEIITRERGYVHAVYKTAASALGSSFHMLFPKDAASLDNASYAAKLTEINQNLFDSFTTLKAHYLDYVEITHWTEPLLGTLGPITAARDALLQAILAKSATLSADGPFEKLLLSIPKSPLPSKPRGAVKEGADYEKTLNLIKVGPKGVSFPREAMAQLEIATLTFNSRSEVRSISSEIEKSIKTECAQCIPCGHTPLPAPPMSNNIPIPPSSSSPSGQPVSGKFQIINTYSTEIWFKIETQAEVIPVTSYAEIEQKFTQLKQKTAITIPVDQTKPVVFYFYRKNGASGTLWRRIYNQPESVRKTILRENIDPATDGYEKINLS